MFNLTYLLLERYFKICKPEKHVKLTVRKVNIAIMCLFLYSIVISLPYKFFGTKKISLDPCENTQEEGCLQNISSESF